MFSIEQEQVVSKFGFRIEADNIVHAKMGLTIPKKELNHLPIQELITYLKTALRNQCPFTTKRPGV